MKLYDAAVCLPKSYFEYTGALYFDKYLLYRRYVANCTKEYVLAHPLVERGLM